MDHHPTTISASRAIRLQKVCDLTAASRTTVWRWVKADPSFPRPFHLSPGITAWDEAEVFAWIATKKAEGASCNA